MWWRFLAFCVLVTLVLFVVLSCIYGKPAVHLFFHRCCGEDIENDQAIFENLGNNFLRERLVATDAAEKITTLLSSEDVDEDSIESTTKLSYKIVGIAFKNDYSSKHVMAKDAVKVENITLFPFENVDRAMKSDISTNPVPSIDEAEVEKITLFSFDVVDRAVKNDFTTQSLLNNDAAEMENITLFAFEVGDKEFRNDHSTEGPVGTDSMEVENLFSFDEVGKAIDDMKKLINVHNPSTRDDLDELEAELTSDDYVLEVTMKGLRKRV